MRISFVVLLGALLVAGPAMPVLAQDAKSAADGPAVVLKTGKRIPCRELPVIAFGRVLYTDTEGVQHSLTVDLVDLEKTRGRIRAKPAMETKPKATSGQARRGGPARPGREAPDFEVTTASGETKKLSDYRGKVVLIDFWATWCGPCRTSMPHLKKINEQHANDPFQLVGVSLDKNKQSLDKYVKAQGLDWPQYFDGKHWANEVAKTYGVRGIPRTVLVNPDGTIEKVGVNGLRLEREIERMLDELKANKSG
ncbi:MAG: TlpA disulfide reductase family protein [Acidobacteriota bacterium]